MLLTAFHRVTPDRNECREELTMGPVCKQNGEGPEILDLQSCNMELLSHQVEGMAIKMQS